MNWDKIFFRAGIIYSILSLAAGASLGITDVFFAKLGILADLWPLLIAIGTAAMLFIIVPPLIETLMKRHLHYG